MKYDFGGYATKYNIKCTDGRTIKHGAFTKNDGQTVPLVWQHLHNEPENILGHVLLEHRDDGVYAYGVFNETESGKNAKELVEHGDIRSLSIYANKLVQNGQDVIHGLIREASLVLAGANSGAVIDNLAIVHADKSETTSEDEAVIYSGIELNLSEEKEEMKINKQISHADDGETLGDVFDTLSEKQKSVVYAMIAQVIEDAGAETDNMSQTDEEGEFMKHNIFEGDDNKNGGPVLTHSQMKEIFTDAARIGSLKESFLQHVATYGIENIDYLFPEAQTLNGQPAMIQRDMTWVRSIIDGTYHSPFSRIKTTTADITADEARARGYVKGALKKEEIIKVLKRVTTPTTIYKKQKLDRDDIVDITDMDVVAFLKAEMRVMLDEELARAVLLGDGRAAESEDKINEENIRPIYSDVDMYVHRDLLGSTETIADFVDAVVESRSSYKGSGNPTLYVAPGTLTSMLLLKDDLKRRLYNTEAELASALRVSKIVEVPLMEGVHRDVTTPAPATLNLLGILVNPKDYSIGADKGGSIGFFDDFDIDYNQYKYLIETRVSGALILPKSAVVIEQTATAG